MEEIRKEQREGGENQGSNEEITEVVGEVRN